MGQIVRIGFKHDEGLQQNLAQIHSTCRHGMNP
jgi:hypothetical protein